MKAVITAWGDGWLGNMPRGIRNRQVFAEKPSVALGIPFVKLLQYVGAFAGVIVGEDAES